MRLSITWEYLPEKRMSEYCLILSGTVMGSLMRRKEDDASK